MRRSLSRRRPDHGSRWSISRAHPLAALFARLTRPTLAVPHAHQRSWRLSILLAVLLALATGGVAGAQPPLAQTLPAGRSIGALPGSRALPATETRTNARWRDEASGTALVMQLVQVGDSVPGQFAFTIPSGDQIVVSGITLGRLPPSTNAPALIQLAQSLSTLPLDASFDSQLTTCAPATVVVSGTQRAAPVIQKGATLSGIATLTLRVGQGGLVAYAALTFAPAGSGTPCVQSSPPQFQLQDGCTAAGCTAPSPPVARVTSYSGALTAAVHSGDWSAVFQQNSQTVRAQYSPGDFAAQMRADAARYGQITAVSKPLGPPLMRVDSAGQAYFVVVQSVTYQLNGSTQRARIASYYLLEDGEWHFWFSEPPQ